MKKTAVKIFSLLLCLCALCALLFSCAKKTISSALPAEDQSETTEKTSMLFLGDSIGEAMAGPTPLSEREAYGYYGIIGNINGFDYRNRAVSGYTSGNLLKYIKQEDDGITMLKSLIASADIIHISILGNDFLASPTEMLVQLAKGNHEIVDRRKANATDHLDQTLAYIRELNPNAVLILQTLYNPADEDSPLITQSARARLAALGIDPSGYHELMNLMVDEINAVLTDYLAVHTSEDGIAPFELIDVYSRCEEVYQKDLARWRRLFCEDGIHPHNEGHALIAEMLQKKLEKLGYAAPNALHNYKKIKTAQLSRLYSDMEDYESVRAAVMRAADFDGVSKAYFDGVEGRVPMIPEFAARSGRTFDETKEFSLTKLKVFDKDITPFFDKAKSYIRFNEDGSYELTATLSSNYTEFIRGYLKSNLPLNVNREVPIDLALLYVNNIAPEIRRTDLEAFWHSFKDRYGFEIIGIDFDNSATQEILRNFLETGQLIITDENVLEKTIAVVCHGSYSLETVTSPLTGDAYTAIYVNNPYGQGEPYVRYTHEGGEDLGYETVRMTIDVAEFALEGILYEG